MKNSCQGIVTPTIDFLGVWWQLIVILKRNPSGILISDPIGPGKWVVEKFEKINPGLVRRYVDKSPTPS